jgi:hypothetical protein
MDENVEGPYLARKVDIRWENNKKLRGEAGP